MNTPTAELSRAQTARHHPDTLPGHPPPTYKGKGPHFGDNLLGYICEGGSKTLVQYSVIEYICEGGLSTLSTFVREV